MSGIVSVVAAALYLPSVSGQSMSPMQPPIPLPLDAYGTWLAFTISHSTSSNWSGGGQDFISVNSYLRSYESISLGLVRLRLNAQLRLGATYLNDTTTYDPLRVGDNEAFGEIVLIRPLKWNVDPYISAGVRTAITESFQYYGQSRFRVARFWDPVVSQQGAGFTYSRFSPAYYLSTRLGLSLAQQRAEKITRLTDDPMTPDVERYHAQSGIESVTEMTARLDSVVAYTGRLGLFGSFDDLSVWSVRSDNEMKILIWKSFGIVLNVTIAHDVRQTLKTQFKESLAVGVVGRF